MTEEAASCHAFGHEAADGAGNSAQWPGHAIELAFTLLDHVLVVTSEQFVATIAGEHYLDVLGGELRHHERWNCRRIAKRFVEIPGEVFDNPDDVGLEHEVMVVGAEGGRHLPRVLEFVER